MPDFAASTQPGWSSLDPARAGQAVYRARLAASTLVSQVLRLLGEPVQLGTGREEQGTWL